ncbi:MULTISPECIES: hypothetical protein [unclassified Moorena]|uniref:hypothetical protein n=1 Tax=unclassified Moorena TaxID=2683338 RepID=UPI0013FF580C|nr:MULTISPECIES: hypothetical protein [unclassified Moorena]NEO14153.1 hypothetical protein [Moorena sp. SIO3E8]NEQ00665.1 hypothetical protein [Moorena sp. SIO3F7]
MPWLNALKLYQLSDIKLSYIKIYSVSHTYKVHSISFPPPTLPPAVGGIPTPDSRLPTPDSRLPTPDSRLPKTLRAKVPHPEANGLDIK